MRPVFCRRECGARADELTMLLASLAASGWALCGACTLILWALRRRFAELQAETHRSRAVLHMQHTMICSLTRALRGETPAPVDDEAHARN